MIPTSITRTRRKARFLAARIARIPEAANKSGIARWRQSGRHQESPPPSNDCRQQHKVYALPSPTLVNVGYRDMETLASARQRLDAEVAAEWTAHARLVHNQEMSSTANATGK